MALSEVVISAVELLEAEARKLGSNFKTLAVGIAVIFAAGGVLLGGVGWLVAAGYLQVRQWLEPAPAAALMGIFCLILAGGGLWYATRKT